MIMNWISEGESHSEQFRRLLAAKADFVVSQYRSLSANFHSNGEYKSYFGQMHRNLRYGENAYQAPACLVKESDSRDPLALSNFKIHAGNPSLINMTDVDRALNTITHIAAAINMHTGKTPFIAIGLKQNRFYCGSY